MERIKSIKRFTGVDESTLRKLDWSFGVLCLIPWQGRLGGLLRFQHVVGSWGEKA